MKLKLVVASMSVLGLISCPVLADTQTKHKHHHHHRMMNQTTVVEHGYKDGYKDMVPVAEVCPKVDMYDSMLDMMSHNVGRAKPTIHCTDPLSLAGGIAFDAPWGNRHMGYTTENTARLALNDAYVNVYGLINDWTTAFLSINFSDFQPYRSPFSYNTALAGQGVANPYTPASANSVTVLPAQGGGAGPNNGYILNGVYSSAYASNVLALEQGYITFKNMAVMPLFLRVGKMFEDFNRYSIHPIVESFTQALSESLHTTAQVGFMTAMGLNGSVYTFDNPMHRATSTGGNGIVPLTGGNSHNHNNYGASLNWNHPDQSLGYNAGIGYLYDFTGINDVAYSIAMFNGTTVDSSGYNGTYRTRVSAGTIYGDLNSGPFNIEARYVTAFNSFSAFDLPTRTRQAILAGGSQRGAKPWAADITAGYGFNAFSRDQNVYVGYQATGNAVNLFLPRSRWLVGYGLNVLKSTNFTAQWTHDYAYSTSMGGRGDTGSNGSTSNLFSVRAAVQFG